MLKILKWFFIPLVMGVLIFIFINLAKRQMLCSEICKIKGFYTSSYIPSSSKPGRGDRCKCLTEAESKETLPEGVEVFLSNE
jgi:hypothetical protein